MYVGIDLGGTNIAAGIVDDNGKILVKDSTPTLGERAPEEIVEDMALLAKKVIKDAGLTDSDIKGIGIGVPGAVSNKDGKVIETTNLPLSGFPLVDAIKKHIDVPVKLENDANAAGFGEYVINGNGAESFVFVTLGTGVGGGIVLNGDILRGSNGVGGEIGHIVIKKGGEKCGCGRLGCWEAYASVTGLIRQTKAAIEAHPDSLMAKMAEEEGKVSGRTSFDCAKKGDKYAKEVVDNYIEYVAEGIVDIVNIFQPNKVVIGGGISKEGDYLLNPIKEYVKKYDYNQILDSVQIEIATLFNDAGIIGAALAAKL